MTLFYHHFIIHLVEFSHCLVRNSYLILDSDLETRNETMAMASSGLNNEARYVTTYIRHGLLQ